jgi:hypothetical protein
MYNSVRIEPIANLAEAVSKVFRQDLRVWQYPSDTKAPVQPKKSLRAEYYRWLLGMSCGALMIRYGCDRHFNKLKKKPRAIKTKQKRRRSSPWLEQFQFGSEYWEDRNLEDVRRRDRVRWS